MPEVVSVIAGATSPEQVERNARAGEWVPSDEEVIELRQLTAVDTSVWKRARSG